MGAKNDIVMIDGQEVAVRCSAATYVLYREEFKADLFAELQAISEKVGTGKAIPDGAIDTLLRATYIMARQADKDMQLSYIDWMDQFDLLGGLDGIQAVYGFLMKDRKTIEEPKKKNGRPSAK